MMDIEVNFSGFIEQHLADSKRKLCGFKGLIVVDLVGEFGGGRFLHPDVADSGSAAPQCTTTIQILKKTPPVPVFILEMPYLALK